VLPCARKVPKNTAHKSIIQHTQSNHKMTGKVVMSAMVVTIIWIGGEEGAHKAARIGCAHRRPPPQAHGRGLCSITRGVAARPRDESRRANPCNI